ncbi:MAG: hypothetical protein A3A33_00205 [Candidatus Yanofskybacteria bacterium RIFCSPLOWO2_01_FULL_49_25]|uniref:Uncharacterized protein n=1 Tax=Candidatus Yanofskybacteria bacterium RIFCSPLOWO2_01_FULL_49_25 TaxID=1802701 RepID=A0A1F8GUH6_9BACT|nr:MAG: hypothetical protein A3A33_00205 [Candidatus Yanofskybacteria bacterium RIFCSPLOWO2_01_FULL_49_25]
MIKDSPNASAVAREVVETIKAGKLVRKGAIAIKHGYGPSIAQHPHKVTKTRSYQLEIAKAVESMEIERSRALALMPSRIGTAKYNHLVDGVDKLTKNIQLLSGHSTENRSIHIEISEVIAKKNQPTVDDAFIEHAG